MGVGDKENGVSFAAVPVTLQCNIHALSASVGRSRKFETMRCMYHPAGILTNRFRQGHLSECVRVCVCISYSFLYKSQKLFVFQTFLIPMERERMMDGPIMQSCNGAGAR